MSYVLHLGDCLTVMSAMQPDSVDAIVTDPPYGLSFMGRDWDHGVPGVPFWAAALRVAKPGAHLLAFGSPRTHHRLMVAIEDAGWEIRDCLMYLYGSGFPKSANVSKLIDKAAPRIGMFDGFAAHFAEQRKASGLSQKSIAAHFPSKTGGMTGCVWNWENGANVPTLAQWRILQPLLNLSNEWLPLIERVEAEREVVAQAPWQNSANHFVPGADHTQRVQLDITAPATDAAKQWDGWGTNLKPAWEPVILARKPLSEANIAANVLRWGTGGLNVDGCRIPSDSPIPVMQSSGGRKFEQSFTQPERRNKQVGTQDAGRWPANLALDEDAAALLDEQSGPCKTGGAGFTRKNNNSPVYAGPASSQDRATVGYEDTVTGASRYFKTVKYDKDDLCIPVNFVESNSSQLSALVDFVLSLAAAGAGLTTEQPRSILSRFTNEMQNVLRQNGDRNMLLILSTARRYLQEFGHMIMEMSSANPVNNAEIQKLTSITTIIQSLLSTDGYAENVTSISMPSYLALGEGHVKAPLRFGYYAKASKRDRDEGLEGMPDRRVSIGDDRPSGTSWERRAPEKNPNYPRKNGHPTVKPTDLMRWLVRLVTPPNGTVLDPFLGSGSTGKAAMLEGFSFVGIDTEAEYLAIADKRIAHAIATYEQQQEMAALQPRLIGDTP